MQKIDNDLYKRDVPDPARNSSLPEPEHGGFYSGTPFARSAVWIRPGSSSCGETLFFSESAAAVPAASPMAKQVPMTRAEAIAMWVAEMQRPETIRFSTVFDSRVPYGMS